MNRQDRENRLRTVVYYACGLLAARYVVWRLLATLWPLPPTVSLSYLFSVASFVVECVLILASFRIVQLMSRTRDRKAEADQNLGWWARSGRPAPIVDILIPTYNESREIVERSIVGAKNQRYGACRVWVLDDGKRPWLEALCRECDVGYLTREENKGAKAGNLNAALSRLLERADPPEFVAVMDCDYVAQPAFVERTLALMHDERTGLVQTPQIFYNPDNFQAAFAANTKVPDALRFTYDTLFPSRDASGSCNCSGTSFLVRVSALRMTDGFPTESVSEDILLSFKLRKAGWKITYLNEILSLGLATEGLGEYQVQRSRWGLGFTQVALLQWASKSPGSSLWKRISTVETCMRIIYTPIARTVFVMLPAVYWFTGMAPIAAPSAQILWYGLPMIVLTRGFLFIASGGRHLPFYLDAVSVVGCVSAARAAVSGFLRPTNRRFVVTGKGLQHDATTFHVKPLLWTAGFGALIAAGVAWMLAGGGPAAQSPSRLAMLVWSFASVLVLVISAAFCVEPPRRRKEERYAAGNEPLEILGPPGPFRGEIVNLSATGLAVRCRELPAQAGSRVEVRIRNVGPVAATVVRSVDATVRGLSLAPTGEQRRALLAKVYSTTYVTPVAGGSVFDMLRGLMRRLLGVSLPPPASGPASLGVSKT